MGLQRRHAKLVNRPRREAKLGTLAASPGFVSVVVNHLSLQLHRLEAVHHLRDDGHLKTVEKLQRPQKKLVCVKHKLYPDRVRQVSQNGRLRLTGNRERRFSLLQTGEGK